MNLKLLLFMCLCFLSACNGDSGNENIDTSLDTGVTTTGGHGTHNETVVNIRTERLLDLNEQLWKTKDRASCQSTFDQMIALKGSILAIQRVAKTNTKVSIEMSESSPCGNTGFSPTNWKFGIERSSTKRTVSFN